ncbi:protein transport protein HofC [Klebsiella spallanzanii]|uniref:Type II secretion system protein F n=1 Tax=Klebsiella spallanzanii TaxID=2587528 RepID=A0A564NVX2_9ENTR|nr:protein transport protein HofC [Klebsiella spallanzanii]VUT10063.1 Type II secretion system protein F [Klebsiella spallanzanii]
MATKRLWRWRGINIQGMPCQGTLWQDNRPEALQMLQRERIIPLTLRRCSVQTALWHPRHSGEIIRQLSALLQAGLPLAEGLELLAQQQPNAQWQALLQTLAEDLAQGISLSGSLEKWPEAFPPLYLAMIRTGEFTGKLDLCCAHLARQQQEQLLLTEKVKKALRYPIIILSLALLVVMGMLCFVLPEFAAIYQTFNTPLPLLTRAVMSVGEGLTHYWPLLAVLGILPVTLNRLICQKPGWLLYRQKLLHKLPVFGKLLCGQRLSQIFTVLSLTQSAGISFLQGLQSVEETLSCPLWRQRLQQVCIEITHGEPIWQAMTHSGGFTPLCLQLIRTGEASGSLDTMLENLARHHNEQTHQQADNLATLLEPMMLVITGTIVGVLVVAMYLPIFHLGDAISGMGG